MDISVGQQIEVINRDLAGLSSSTRRNKLLWLRNRMLVFKKEHGYAAVFRGTKSKFDRNTQDTDVGYRSLIAKLAEVELRLDHQLSDKNERHRLQRKSRRYRRQLAGLDPRYSAGLEGSGGIPEEKRDEIQVLCAIIAIMNELNQEEN